MQEILDFTERLMNKTYTIVYTLHQD